MDNTLYSHYEEKIRPCIDLIDSLRALGVEKDLALPAIAVIGDQSSGKSSVLEALSGVTLPRGSGIVTRCPLELKLKKVEKGTEWSGKICFEDRVKDLSSPSEVEKEIIRAQNSLAGTGVGISHDLISLEICSPEVPDLTLIDLPGIARVAVGDQPKDIGDQIKSLITRFIEKQETINLVVVPSNVDIATTEALEMARLVDPRGERTLGILTKPDLVDKGTEENVVEVVRNNTIPLMKGYMIVKCRGQQEIQDKLSLCEAIEKEKKFFQDNMYFRSLLTDGYATVPVLAEKLTTELVDHIGKSLPDLEKQIKGKLQDTRDAFDKCGKGVPEEEGERLAYLIEIIRAFTDDIVSVTHGEEVVVDKMDTRLFTKVRSLFSNWKEDLDHGTAEFKSTLKEEVEIFEKRHRGRELPGFINYKTFEALVRMQIKKLEEPAVQNLKRVTHFVQQAFNELAMEHFLYLRNLHKAAKHNIEHMRQTQELEAENKIRTQFEMEQMVYSQDHLYSVDLKTVKDQAAKDEAALAECDDSPLRFVPKIFRTERISIEEMVYHLEAYFLGAVSRLANQIPLIIRYCILQENGRKLQSEMLKLLHDRDAYDMLLQENNEIYTTRIRLKERIKRLNQAYDRLAQFPA